MFLAENAATIRPAPCAHGSRSLRLMHMGPVFCVRSLVGSPVAPVSVDSSDCDLAPFAHPFVEAAASGRLQRHALTIATGSFAPAAVIRALTKIYYWGSRRIKTRAGYQPSHETQS